MYGDYRTRGPAEPKRAPAAAPRGAPAAHAAGAKSFPLLGDADARVRATVAAMSRVAAEAIRDPAIVQRAADIVRDVDGHNASAQIPVLRAWLAANVRFVADPLIDGDVIRTPALLLMQLDKVGVMQGDCDDVATLAATLGQAVGIPARFVTLAFIEPNAPYSHVFCELQDQHGQWHELDVTEPAEKRARVQPTRRAVYPAAARPLASLTTLLGIAEAAYLLVGVVQGVRGFMREMVDDV